MKETIKSIKTSLNSNFTCYRPTIPTDEDLLTSYSKDTVINELTSFSDNAQKAIDSDCEKESSEFWRKIFGDRFPLGKEKETTNSLLKAAPLTVPVSKPFYDN